MSTLRFPRLSHPLPHPTPPHPSFSTLPLTAAFQPAGRRRRLCPSYTPSHPTTPHPFLSTLSLTAAFGPAGRRRRLCYTDSVIRMLLAGYCCRDNAIPVFLYGNFDITNHKTHHNHEAHTMVATPHTSVTLNRDANPVKANPCPPEGTRYT